MKNIVQTVFGFILKLVALVMAWCIRLPIIILEKLAKTLENYAR
jgi:hypothetical protein